MITVPSVATWAVIAALVILALVTSKIMRTVVVLGVLLVATRLIPFVDVSLL